MSGKTRTRVNTYTLPLGEYDTNRPHDGRGKGGKPVGARSVGPVIYDDRSHKDHIMVYLALDYYCQGRKAWCWPSSAGLSYHSRTDRKTVGQVVKDLVEWGYVVFVREPRRGGSGPSRTPVYWLPLLGEMLNINYDPDKIMDDWHRWERRLREQPRNKRR